MFGLWLKIPTKWRAITRLHRDAFVNRDGFVKRPRDPERGLAHERQAILEVLAMFTAGAGVLISFIAWYANRANKDERRDYDRSRTHDRGPDDLWVLSLHTRQDIKLIAYLLYGVIVLLGIIADKIK
jgi:hypothetical protein